ncbi:MAG: TolC family protein [Cyclobacteriaceae bacterium]|nr:TolC family protein [Cyclobacteriaceae bacterium]
MKRIVLVFLAAFFSVSSFAQIDTLKQERQTPPSIKKWNLKECIDYALANNLTVERSELGVGSAEVDFDQARLSRLPSINGAASYGSSWGRGLDPVTNSFAAQQINSSNLSANASWLLFNGLRQHNTVNQTRSSLGASEQDLLKAKNDLILNVAALFINVVFNKELVQNARFQLASSQQQLERARKQVEAGSLPLSEQLNLDAQVASNEVTLVQQENALALSILRLKQALRIPASEAFDAEVPQLEPEDLVIDQSRDEIFSIARQSMPEVKAAQLRIQSTRFALKAARGSLFPRITLNGAINTNYSSAQNVRFYPDGTFFFAPDAEPVAYLNQDLSQGIYTLNRGGEFRDYGAIDQFQDNIYKTLGVNLSIPIFNGYATRASIRRSSIQHRLAQITAQETEQTLRQSVETAYNDALSSSKTYNASLRQVKAREEAYRMMDQRLQAGSANSFEVQVSQNSLFQAQTDLARAKYDFIFKKKVLDFYQGKSLEY